MRSSSIIILFVASLDSTDLISGLNYQRAFLVGTLAATHTTASLPLQLYMTTSIYVAGYTRVFTYAPMLCFISKFYNARCAIRLISTNISHILLIRRTEWMIPPVLGIHWLVNYFHRLCILVAPGNKDDLVLHRH